MEDNEFEEVTIISHTDHGTSVLPQSTAERLMKEIKLEVTQKISQNENVKLGSLQHSTTPTLLDSIYQFVAKKKAGSISTTSVRFFSPHVLAPEQKILTLGSNIVLLQPDTEGNIVETLKYTANSYIYFAQWWADRYFLAQNGNSVIILDKDFQYVKSLDVKFDGANSWHFLTTKNYAYFRGSDRKCIHRIDKAFKVQAVENCPEYVLDFSVTQADVVWWVNESTLGSQSGASVPLTCSEEGFAVERLKQMYSDHFLVVSKLMSLSRSTGKVLHLVDSENLEVVDTLVLGHGGPTTTTYMIRLLYPRSKMHCFLVSFATDVALFARLGNKLYFLQKAELAEDISALTFIEDGMWVTAGDQLNFRSLLVTFPEGLLKY